jgi:GNAT superfamily N-acetyltransferase
MNWYKKAQSFGELSRKYKELSDARYALIMKEYDGTATPEEKQQRTELDRQSVELDAVWRSQYEARQEQAAETVRQGRPHEVSQDHFVDYHRTGTISEDAYEDYGTIEGLSWISKDEHPILLKREEFGGEMLEFRQTGEELKYVRHDESGEIDRDEQGLATYLSPEEVAEKGAPSHDVSISVFNEKGQAVASASDEFGTDGVWVVKEYRGRGLGVDLLHELRKNFKPGRKMGQMTSSGVDMAKAYHKRLVREALERGDNVPQDVLDEYANESWARQ